MSRGIGRVLLAALLSALLGCSGTSQQVASEPVTTPPADGPRPFLWQVERDGVKPSYLLGTFHIGVDPDDVFPDSVYAKLERARAVVLEVNIAVTDSLGLGMQPPGQSLDQQMPPDKWQQLVDALKLSPEEADKIKQVKVWVIYTTLLQELVPETRSIDGELQRRARDAGRALVFLEEVAFQQKLFDKYMTVDMLLGVLGDKDEQRELLAQQAAAFKSGDEQAMYDQSLAPEMFSSEEARNEIVYDRNRAWIEPLEVELGKGNAFVAVGASHLIGPDGVVDLLRERGWTVRRIYR
jgi:uncharacterized protein YbaP (TraB family)